MDHTFTCIDGLYNGEVTNNIVLPPTGVDSYLVLVTRQGTYNTVCVQDTGYMASVRKAQEILHSSLWFGLASDRWTNTLTTQSHPTKWSTFVRNPGVIGILQNSYGKLSRPCRDPVFLPRHIAHRNPAPPLPYSLPAFAPLLTPTFLPISWLGGVDTEHRTFNGKRRKLHLRQLASNQSSYVSGS